MSNLNRIWPKISRTSPTPRKFEEEISEFPCQTANISFFLFFFYFKKNSTNYSSFHLKILLFYLSVCVPPHINLNLDKFVKKIFSCLIGTDIQTPSVEDKQDRWEYRWLGNRRFEKLPKKFYFSFGRLRGRQGAKFLE